MAYTFIETVSKAEFALSPYCDAVSGRWQADPLLVRVMRYQNSSFKKKIVTIRIRIIIDWPPTRNTGRWTKSIFYSYLGILDCEIPGEILIQNKSMTTYASHTCLPKVYTNIFFITIINRCVLIDSSQPWQRLIWCNDHRRRTYMSAPATWSRESQWYVTWPPGSVPSVSAGSEEKCVCVCVGGGYS